MWKQCARKVFSEQTPGIIRYSRRTKRATRILETFAIELTGRLGNILSEQLHITVSSSTITRIAHGHQLMEITQPRVLGVDDWAYRKGSNGKWRVFMTTNTELSFIKMIEIYQIRWTMEVFFKEAKQLLGLGKCQSKDFDAQISDTTITMIQHILLTLKYRFEHYETKGALFNHVREGIIQSRLDERLWGLFIELIRLIEVLFDGIDEMELWGKILKDERAYEMIERLLPKEPELQKAA